MAGGSELLNKNKVKYFILQGLWESMLKESSSFNFSSCSPNSTALLTPKVMGSTLRDWITDVYLVYHSMQVTLNKKMSAKIIYMTYIYIYIYMTWHTHDNEFTLLKWPPQSPDLNLIEHLWDVVEREIHIMDVQPTNLQQLCDAIMTIWTNISEESFQHLVESMPQVCMCSIYIYIYTHLIKHLSVIIKCSFIS